MKKKSLTVLCCLLLALVIFVACEEKRSGEGEWKEASGSAELPAEGKWAEASYRENKSFGEGKKTVDVKVVAEGMAVTFTIRSDETYLGDALLEHKLIEGDMSEFGIYIKKVNGILADYDIDKTYWGFYKNGEMMMTGVSSAEFADGEQYELVLES